ncbi:unnamed protein product [Heterosigma akashiwo]
MKRPTAAAICFAACLATAFGAGISTVDSVDLAKYAGRWYQVYSNAYTEALIFPGAVCVTADYALDLTAGRPQVTVRNAGRLDPQEGGFNTVEGYAYVPDARPRPGSSKMRLGRRPADGDYWIGLLGPAASGGRAVRVRPGDGPLGPHPLPARARSRALQDPLRGGRARPAGGMWLRWGDGSGAAHRKQAGCRHGGSRPRREAAAAPAGRGERKELLVPAEERLQLLAEATYGRFTGPPAAARAADAVVAALAAPASPALLPLLRRRRRRAPRCGSSGRRSSWGGGTRRTATSSRRRPRERTLGVWPRTMDLTQSTRSASPCST